MQKIPTLFLRDDKNSSLVIQEVNPECAWVIAGEGTPTLKIDGTCCLIKAGVLYKRYDVRQGKVAPPGFIPAQEPDMITGHWPGWLPVGDGPEDQYFREGFEDTRPSIHTLMPCGYENNTYELIGPKVQGNPYRVSSHRLIMHGGDILYGNPRTFDELRDYLSRWVAEGIVWHHADGRMAKIKTRDFGLQWPR